MTAMECVFEKVFYISSELLRMQKFWTFTDNVHKLAKCKEDDCSIDAFLKNTKDVFFNEELSYDKRRIYFTETCLAHLSVFNAMFQLHHKGKENNRIENLIENPSDILKRQVGRNEELTKLILEKYVIQKKIDSVVEDLFMKTYFFF